MAGKSGSFLLGLVLGTLVGMILALLLTPQSGEETRELLTEKAATLRHQAQDVVEKGRETVEQVQSRLQVLRPGESPDEETSEAPSHT